MCDIYIKEYFFRYEKEIMPISTTGMDIEGILLSGINQIEDEHFMVSIIYRI